MKTITMYELLGLVKEGKAPKKIIFDTEKYEWSEPDKTYIRHIDYNFKELDDGYCLIKCLDDTVEILEEENELRANSVEFNINNNKRDCVITLDENDLGIDKLHLDNCYFYKENGKWYVKKYDFKTIKLEEEKKIPEKLEYYDDSIAWVIDDVGQLSDVDKVIIDKLNEVLDYLKSKGDE